MAFSVAALRGRPVVSMAIGVGMATGLYGLSFGALSTAAGLSIWQTQVLSLLMYSGGSQFAFVGVIAASGIGGVVPAIVSAWLLGIRNGFYALRMNSLLSLVGLPKLLAAQLTIDESNAVSASQDNEADSKLGFWLAGGSVFVFWNLFTYFGAVLGQSIGDPRTWGLDAAAAAAFLGLVWPRLRNLQAGAIGALAVMFTLFLVGPMPSGIPVILAAPVAVAIVYALKRTPLKKYLDQEVRRG